MPDTHIQELLYRFFQGTITPEEKEALATWIEESDDQEGFKTLLAEVWTTFQPPASLVSDHADRLLTEVLNRANAERVARLVPFYKRPWARAAAAAVVLLLGTAGYWLLMNRPAQPIAVQAAPARDVAPPNGSHTVLTLAGGRQILLDNAGKGRLADQGGAEVSKTDSGELAYRLTGTGSAEYNTLSTGSGGLTMLTLSDGTKVWLNSVSSLKYPVAFTGKERTVYMSGEGYFEVAPDKSRPFHVKIDGPAGQERDVQVLGTRFNIMAYGDEAEAKTTLLEGAVKVTASRAEAFLSPGEQAQMPATGTIRIVKDVDPQQVIAWKEGTFDFEEEDIRVIMRQLARWYDVEIDYQGNPPTDLFTAIIRKDNSISQVLRMMEQTRRIHFQIDHKKIIVMP
jgi:transmembrane sensor